MPLRSALMYVALDSVSIFIRVCLQIYIILDEMVSTKSQLKIIFLSSR